MSTTTTEVTCAEIFQELDKWIRKNPGLDPRDYGADANGRMAYREEALNIRHDARRARKALREARLMKPRADVLLDSFRAFSGRLEWKDGRLSYTTGQYWPTEYRKAAASVLEQYVTTSKQIDFTENPRTFTYTTMADVKAANKAVGGSWFSAENMRFFNARIESGLIGWKYFVTSERFDYGNEHPRLFTIRAAMPDGSIETVGKFQEFSSKGDAVEIAKGLSILNQVGAGHVSA